MAQKLYDLYAQQPAIEPSDPVGAFTWQMRANLNALEYYLNLRSSNIARIVRDTRDGGRCSLSFNQGPFSGTRFEVQQAVPTKKVWVAVALMHDDTDVVSWHAIGNSAEEASANLLTEAKALLQEADSAHATDADAQAWVDDNFDCPAPFEIEVPLP
mgnify:CR=1 FL=1